MDNIGIKIKSNDKIAKCIGIIEKIYKYINRRNESTGRYYEI